MAFDLSTATEVESTGGFDMGSAKVVNNADVPEPVYREKTGETISAPADLSGQEVGYLDDVNNLGEEKQSFFGYNKVIGRARDIAQIPFKGAVATSISAGATLEAGARLRTADAINQGLTEDIEALRQKRASGQDLTDEEARVLLRDIGDKNFIFDFLFKSPEDVAREEARRVVERGDTQEAIRLQEKAVSLTQSVANIRKRADDLIEARFARPIEDESTLAERILYDASGVVTTVAASIGLAVVTKNPVSSAVLFSELQNSDVYLEARDAAVGVEKSRAKAALAGKVEGALEFIGVNYFFKIAESSTGLRKHLFRMGEEFLQEGAQQTAEEFITQTGGIREKDLQGAFERIGYSAFLGSIGGGISSVGLDALSKKMAKEEGLPPDLVKEFMQRVQVEGDTLMETVAIDMDGEASPVKSQTEAQNIDQAMGFIEAFAMGNDIDTSNLSEKDRALIESAVEKRLEEIDAQTGANLLPIPKRPETLSQFLISQGGLKDDTGEARRFTRKETPTLKGVAKKTGTLSLDEARALAVEAGFLVDTGVEGVTESTEQDLLDALEQEALGVDIVRDVDLGALQDREAVLEFNVQRDEANQQLLQNKQEVKSFRTAFNRGVTAARTDVKSSQEVIITALEDAKLRPEDRAKFIRQIKNIQTPKQLEKAAPKIEQKVADLLEVDAKRNVRKSIKKAIKSAKSRKDIAIDLVDNIRKLEKDFADTGILGAGFKDTSLEDFQRALEQTNLLLAQGKIKLLILKEQKKELMARRLEDLEVDTVPLSNTELATAPLGERLGVKDKLKNVWIEGANKVQRLGINKNPMDVIFDIMDGGQEYQGANSRIFKKTADKSYGRFLQLKEATTRPVKDLADKLKLDERNFDRIGAWAALQQESGEAKLLQSGVTQAEIDALQLTEPELEMFNLMREKLDAMRPALLEVMRVAYNKDFGNVKDYFPFMTDFKAMNDFEIQEMFGNDAFLVSDTPADFNKKDVKKNFTKERTGVGKQKIRIDALGVFLNHMENATYLIEMGQDIKELGELAATKDFRDISGDLGQQITLDWIDLLARKGRVSGNIDFLDTIRINTGAAVLGFKLSSALIQPTALMDGAAFVGASYVSRGVVNVANDDWRKFMKANIPEIRERVGDDPNYIDMEGDGFLSKQKQAGFWALKSLDLLSASAVASAAYTKSVEQRGGQVDLLNPDPIAIEEAQLAVRRTQSSAFAKDTPPIISQGKLTGNISVDKMILQFQSFMFNRWSLIEHDFWNAGVRKGRTKKALNIAVWLTLANITEKNIRHYTKELISLLTGAEPPEREDLMVATAKQAISNVPFVSSVVSSSEYGSVPVPSISLIESTFESLSFALKSKNKEKKFKHFGTAAITGVGGAFGISGTFQAKQLVQSVTSGKGSKKRKSKVFNP